MENSFLNSAPVFIDITAATLQVVRGKETATFALTREPGGKLTLSGRGQITAELRKFIDRKSWQPRIRAYCAVPAAGLTLRRFQLPPATGEELRRLLRLQIEAELPLAPEELAWGWLPMTNRGSAKQKVLVAAVRKEVIAEYAGVLVEAGLVPVFTPAALARHALVTGASAEHAMLAVGPTASELIWFRSGKADSLRIIPWGRDQAAAAVGSSAKIFGSDWTGGTIYLSGEKASLADSAAKLREQWRLPVEIINAPDGRPAAIAGLEKLVAQNEPMLTLETAEKPAAGRWDFSGAETKLWLRRVLGLLVALLLLPYVEALLLQPVVAKKYAAVKAQKERLAALVDPELQFLQFLKQSQPPYLDALFLFAKAAPPGTRLDPVSLNQRGEISLRAVFQNAQQVSDFRLKLNDGGYFTNVVVEEQSPTPDHQRLNVRMSVRWNAPALRAGIKVNSVAPETEKKQLAVPAEASAFPAKPTNP